MTVDWFHAGPSMLATFLASLVEFVEALTVILAVGAIRGWRGALGGTVMALALLVVLIAALGPALTSIPLNVVQVMVGALLILFGMRWLRKAILRSSGIVPLHDEEAAYAKESAALQSAGGIGDSWDRLAVSTAFQITMLEGIEVVFIVIAFGAASRVLLIAASMAALAALVVVVVLGVALHRPISRVPENTLKTVVGILLTAFGTFWFGEGIGLAWPGSDWSILGLIVGFACMVFAAVQLCLRRASAPDAVRKGSSFP